MVCNHNGKSILFLTNIPYCLTKEKQLLFHKQNLFDFNVQLTNNHFSISSYFLKFINVHSKQRSLQQNLDIDCYMIFQTWLRTSTSVLISIKIKLQIHYHKFRFWMDVLISNAFPMAWPPVLLMLLFLYLQSFPISTVYYWSIFHVKEKISTELAIFSHFKSQFFWDCVFAKTMKTIVKLNCTIDLNSESKHYTPLLFQWFEHLDLQCYNV